MERGVKLYRAMGGGLGVLSLKERTRDPPPLRRLGQQIIQRRSQVLVVVVQGLQGPALLEAHVLELPCRYLRSVYYDPSTTNVTCGPGALWSDLIVALDPHGRGPHTMQSYCTFSVDGTLAVNAHGITSDDSMASCVVSLSVVTAENGVATLREVTREDDLFGHVLGGYGLFGIVTSVMTDVTEGVRAALGQRRVGELVLSQGELTSMRSRGSEAGADVDNLRSGLLQVATLGKVGKNKLELEYTLIDSSSGLNEGERVTSLASLARFLTLPTPLPLRLASLVADTRRKIVDELKRSGATKRLHETQGGEYTFYKLVEWMQVEILALFADSLNHTPWFRFPFKEVFTEYFKMLRIESGVVEKIFGTRTAFASMAFLTDVIPGVVMGGVFAQLSLLAIPLRMVQPANYDGFDQETFCEEIVVVGLSAEDAGRIGGENVKKSKSIVDGEGRDVAVVLEVPPFKAMGDCLQKIARASGEARVLEVSGLGFVQARVSCGERAASFVRSKGEEDGIDFIGSYQFPVDNHTPDVKGRVQLAFKIEVTLLLVFLQWVDSPECTRAGVKLEQIYDFWG